MLPLFKQMLQQLEPLGGADRIFRKQTLECSERLEPTHVQEEFGDLEVVCVSGNKHKIY